MTRRPRPGGPVVVPAPFQLVPVTDPHNFCPKAQTGILYKEGEEEETASVYLQQSRVYS